MADYLREVTISNILTKGEGEENDLFGWAINPEKASILGNRVTTSTDCQAVTWKE